MASFSRMTDPQTQQFYDTHAAPLAAEAEHLLREPSPPSTAPFPPPAKSSMSVAAAARPQARRQTPRLRPRSACRYCVSMLSRKVQCPPTGLREG